MTCLKSSFAFLDDPFRTSFGTSNNTVLVPNILQLLRFCLLTRKDVPTITLLNLLSEEPKRFIDIVWKVKSMTSMKVMMPVTHSNKMISIGWVDGGWEH